MFFWKRQKGVLFRYLVNGMERNGSSLLASCVIRVSDKIRISQTTRRSGAIRDAQLERAAERIFASGFLFSLRRRPKKKNKTKRNAEAAVTVPSLYILQTHIKSRSSADFSYIWWDDVKSSSLRPWSAMGLAHPEKRGRVSHARLLLLLLLLFDVGNICHENYCVFGSFDDGRRAPLRFGLFKQQRWHSLVDILVSSADCFLFLTGTHSR